MSVCFFGNRIRSNPAMTGMKLTPSQKKQSAMPRCAMRNPATEGPTIRAQLNAELLSEIAFVKCSRLVVSIGSDWGGGVWSAMVIRVRAGGGMVWGGWGVWVGGGVGVVGGVGVGGGWVGGGAERFE